MLAKVGQPAPAFKLKSTKGATSAKNLGAEVSLSDYKGKWLIFFFYPLDFTFVCPTEIRALSDRLDELKKLRIAVPGTLTSPGSESPTKQGSVVMPSPCRTATICASVSVVRNGTPVAGTSPSRAQSWMP